MVHNKTKQSIINWYFCNLILTAIFICSQYKDLTSNASNWYFHSTPVWLIVMFIGSIIFLLKWREIGRTDKEQYNRFKVLPKE